MLTRPALLALLCCTACSAARPEPPAPPPHAHADGTRASAGSGAVRADLHIHLTMDRAAKPVFKGSAGDPLLAGSPGVILRNQIDVDTLAQSGVRLLVGAVWPPFRLRPGRTERDEALHQLIGLRRFAGATRGITLARSAGHARALLRDGHVVVIPAVEGGEGLRAVEDVDLYFAAGARVVTLVHFTSNELGGAAHGQLGRVLGLRSARVSENGLTEHGRAVVRRLIELGMVIDLAHASDRTMQDVLDITEPLGVPVLYSHAGARHFSPMERNLGDDLAARIAGAGGLVGVTLFDGFLSGVPEDSRLPDHVPGTCDDVVAHWLHFAKVAGPENVTLGSDWNGFVSRPLAGGRCADGLRNTSDLPALYEALTGAGVPQAALDGSGERLLRLMEMVEAKASPAARAEAERRTIPAFSVFDVPL